MTTHEPAAPTSTDWQSANQAYLASSLDRVAVQLGKALDDSSSGDADQGLERLERRQAEIAKTMSSPPAIEIAVEAFGLSDFERDILLACAGVELNASFADICRSLQGGVGRSRMSFGLALTALEGAHWSALHSAAPLRYWRLVELEPGNALSSRLLKIDERVLHFLAGVSHLDERLSDVLEPLGSGPELPDSYVRLADRIVLAWSDELLAEMPRIQLCGSDKDAKRAVGMLACSVMDIPLLGLDATDLPATPAEIEELARLWNREVLLSSAALLVEVDDPQSQDLLRRVASLSRRLRGPILLSSRDPLPADRLAALRIDIDRPEAAERRELWLKQLADRALSLNGGLDAIVSQFELGVGGIQSASLRLRAREWESMDDPDGALWDICREQARPRLDDLAHRIPPVAGWDDLVLPAAQLQLLRDVAAQVRQRSTVYEDWGFAATSSRGLGISALFSGPSGTGKTMAAEVMARDLRLDLYRIDLSQVVNKYIGETEKNLRRVFDAAEDGGAVLLFDEADAIFGKRSQVKDSHDRYANIEVSYLLQRMESYRGLAILTTNLQNAIDKAFLRRIRFVVHFPFPDEAQRAEIWRRMFPAETPIDELDYRRLARMSFAGGNIRNVAMNAAFLAAEDGHAIGQSHVLEAARHEYMKLEMPFSDAEFARLKGGRQ